MRFQLALQSISSCGCVLGSLQVPLHVQAVPSWRSLPGADVSPWCDGSGHEPLLEPALPELGAAPLPRRAGHGRAHAGRGCGGCHLHNRGERMKEIKNSEVTRTGLDNIIMELYNIRHLTLSPNISA